MGDSRTYALGRDMREGIVAVVCEEIAQAIVGE